MRVKASQHTLRLTKVAQLPRSQRGATLIVALVMLLLISLLAIGGMQGSILQERMSSNAHDGALSFQATEAALRQGENDILSTLATRQTADLEAFMITPWSWDGNNPAISGTGDAGTGVSSPPVYHLAHLAFICPIEIGQPCFERYVTTARGQGGTDEAVTVLQSTVLLPPN